MPNGKYEGRLVTDGNGNLLADEGQHKGEPVAYHEGSYVFVQPGEPSHNERHHEQFVVAHATQDADPDAPGFADPSDPETAHHFGPTEDDPHYDPDADSNTRLRQMPDKQAKVFSGHTEAYRG